MTLEEQFAERLADLRTQKGVSARDMSLSIGQSAGYINGIENQKNLPSMTVFFYICEYLNISPQEFFTFDVQNPQRLNCSTKGLSVQDINSIFCHNRRSHCKEEAKPNNT